MKTKTATKFSIAFLVSILLCGGLVYALYQVSLKTESVKVHYAESLKGQNVDSTQRLQKEQQTLAYQEGVIKKVFLSEANIVDFITNLESQAKIGGLDIEISKVEKGEEEKFGNYKVQSVTFNISLEGTYREIEGFIEKISSDSKPIEVKEFKLYKSGIEGSLYNGRITLTSNLLSL